MMSTFCYNVRYRCCDCSLKTFGYVYGWMGVIWRTVTTMFLAVTLSRTTEYDPNIFHIGLITVLTYLQLSLVTNFFFLIGIHKEKPYYMLPFVVIGGMELFFGVVIFVGGTILLDATRSLQYLLWGFVPITLAILVTYLFFWIKSIQLYREIEVEIGRKEEENARIESIRQSLVNS